MKLNAIMVIKNGEDPKIIKLQKNMRYCNCDMSPEYIY